MKFGLIGHPIAHSMSPALFNAGYDRRYVYDLIESADFEYSYNQFLEHYDGINVTAPFKELAFAKADVLAEECRMIGAANLLVKSPEGVKAYNSDYLGVRQWLQEISETSGRVLKNVLIVGCGGAGKAATLAAASLGMHCVLMNRDMKRADALSDHLQRYGFCTEVRPLEAFREAFEQADVVIYNVPTAINQLVELVGRGRFSEKSRFLLEANYKNPSFDAEFLLKLHEICPNLDYTGGRTWLLYQAHTGYEIFTGEKPDLSKMSDVL